MSSDTYISDFHFLNIINTISSQSTLVDEGIKSGIGGDQHFFYKSKVGFKDEKRKLGTM